MGIDAFKLWCWRRLLRVPWTARRSNQSILKEISPEYSLVELMLKLKLQFFGHLMQRTDSLEKTLMLGKIEGRRRWDSWMASLIWWTWVWANSGRMWRTGKPGVLQSTESKRVGYDWGTELNWTELNNYEMISRNLEQEIPWPFWKTQERLPLLKITIFLCHIHHIKRLLKAFCSKKYKTLNLACCCCC